MPEFFNTVQKDIITSLKANNERMLKNEYFTGVNNKRATLVDFININTDASNIDESTNLSFSSNGEESPIRYDKIIDLFLYDVPTADINIELGDFGLESDMDGESLIPPNVFVPVVGSFFYFKNTKSPALYKVTNVNVDTLENGANYFKINYKLDKKDIHLVDDQIINEFIFMVDKVGTQFKPLILKSDHDDGLKLQNALTELNNYYKALFYSDRVDTFILYINDKPFYDAQLMEFIIKNKLFKYCDEYIYIDQKTSVSSLFYVEYMKSFFRAVEERKINENKLPVVQAVARFIDDQLSILSMRQEYYYMMTYLNDMNMYNIKDYIIDTISPLLMEKIKTFTLTQGSYTNIIIKFLNNAEITMNDILTLNDINYKQSIELFYHIPILIYIIKDMIEKLAK